MEQQIDTIFVDLGDTFRVIRKDEAYQSEAKAVIARLLGVEGDPAAFYREVIEPRYDKYREWALTFYCEAPVKELWTRWLAYDFPRERVEAAADEMTCAYRKTKGERVVTDGGAETVRELYKRGYTLGIVSDLVGVQEVDEWLESARLAMTEIREKSKKDKRRGYRETYMEAAVNLTYQQYVYQNGKDNYFRQDNFREQERVKSLYRSADSLFNAYRDVPFFEVTHEDKQYPLTDNDRLARHRQTSRKQRRIFLLEQFERIAYLRFSPDEKDQDRYSRYLARILSSEYDCMFHECYLRKGADYIRSVDFKDSEIKRAVEEAGTTIFRKKQQLKEIVEKQFRVGETYSRSDSSVILTAAYRKVGLPVNKRVSATQLKDYFEIKEVNITSGRFLKIVGKK